jgi:hypothetical protein
VTNPDFSVMDILREGLVRHGFDGLCTQDCGCPVDDLCPCRADPMMCEPGYDYGPGDYGEGPCDIWIGPDKTRRAKKKRP